MKRFLTVFLFCAAGMVSLAQVKSSYQYHTSMPYGVLDIRTKISSTNYYYLKEGQTFAFRESSPGVKTNSYLDMTSWESSPYQQGHLRHKNGSADKFIMNYRLLFPANYNTSYAEGYPLIVLMHGAGERGNCLYDNCYHSGWNYDPNVNSPAAPTASTHKLLNNDHNLFIGGKQHLDARNLAGTRLPNDPSMPTRAFPGFVLVPQMFNVWDSLNVQDVVRIVRLHCEKYKIDPNRIYIHGLSIGGYGVYEALMRASWLFAAALPMSAIRDANIFKYNQQGRVIHVPIWTFQGELDKAPTAAYTNTVVQNFRNAGAVIRYTLYIGTGHAIWNKAYAEPDFFTWMLSKSKANIHPYKGITVIIRSKNQYPKLMLAEGFLAYQWEKDGVIISGATANTYTATATGTYRARFSRLSTAPTATQWNKWSAPVTVTEAAAAQVASSGNPDEIIMERSMMDEEFSVSVYPNPTTASDLNIEVNTMLDAPIRIEVMDQMGRKVYESTYTSSDAEHNKANMPILTKGIYVVFVTQGQKRVKERIIIQD